MGPVSARMCLFLLNLQAVLLGVARGKLVEGVVETKENWVFLSRFCFLSEEGNFEYLIEYDKDKGIPNLLFYTDDDSQWPSVYPSSKTCREREAVVGEPGRNQIIKLSYSYPDTEFSGCVFGTTVKELPDEKSRTTITPETSTIADANSTRWDELVPTDDLNFPTHLNSQPDQNFLNNSDRSGETGRLLVTCHNIRKFRSARDRWWFFAISNCDSSKGLDITYMLLMTNGQHGDFWQEHFSADEYYVLPVLLGYTFAYVIVMIAVVICSFKLKSRHLFHSTYKLFLVSIVMQHSGVVIQCLAYIRYALTGFESTTAKIVGQYLCSVSETTFLLLLVLLAKGYTVTTDRLKVPFTATMTIIICGYMLTYIVLFIYQAKAFDSGEVLYLYESPAGYGLIVLRMVAWLVFAYSTFFTVKKYREKKKFYSRLFIYGTLWFFAGPLLIFAAIFYIEKWERESLLAAVVLSIPFCGHIMFLLLTLPVSANKCFPYHIRTTHIGEMTDCVEVTNHYTLSAASLSASTPVGFPSTGKTKVDKKKSKGNVSSSYNSLMVDTSDALSEKEKVTSSVHTKTTLPGFLKSDLGYSSQL